MLEVRKKRVSGRPSCRSNNRERRRPNVDAYKQQLLLTPNKNAGVDRQHQPPGTHCQSTSGPFSHCHHLKTHLFANWLNCIAYTFITGRICRRQLCRYCFYSRPNFGVFRPSGAILWTVQGEIWQGGAAPPGQISSWSIQGWGFTASKTEKKIEIYQYNCP